jgi:pimeloyl-ACP methyl ester carboxylesterase
MPTLVHEGKAVNYVESGAGDSVVLLHAGGSSGRQWRKVAGSLEADYRLIAPDLFGFGETEPWSGSGDLTHNAQAALVRELIVKVCNCPAHVVGHSYGGATAMRLWLMAPDLVRSLVFIEPILTPLLPQVGEDVLFAEYCAVAEDFLQCVGENRNEDAWRGFLNLRNGDGTWERLSDDAKKRFTKGTDQAVDAFKSNLNNPTTLEDCRGVSVSTTIICGANTTAPERRVTEILRDEIPNSAYEIIPEAEHMSPLTHPVEVAMLIRKHLA